MTIAPGTYRLGPEQGTLSVRTGKAGAAAKAAHNLLIAVGTWSATLTMADGLAAARVELSADARSLRVLEGSGGISSLGDDDKANIEQTIDDEVLAGTAIAFRSTEIAAAAGGDGLTITGELELAGVSRPLNFALAIGDGGRLTATAVITQSNWGMKPYSALFGTLKVSDDVQVALDARLPDPS